MLSHQINQYLCRKCRLCIMVCPNTMIAENSEGKTEFIADRLEMCIGCGQCMAVCEPHAVQVPGVSYDTNIFHPEGATPSAEDFYNLLATRRSVRNFKNQPVPEEVIQKIIDAIDLAPYGSEHDNIHITVVKDRAVIDKALPLMSEFYDKVEGWLHSRFMRFMMKKKLSPDQFNTLDNHLMPRLVKKHYDTSDGKDNITRHAPAVLIFHADKSAPEHKEDAFIFVTYATLAAHSLGLGATICGLVGPPINKMPELREMFQIPESNEVVVSLLIGYPKVKYKSAIRHGKKPVTWL
ncbi:MAG: nitroreductase family protein [Bacteroidetes bacterium]|nr:nitroreductase family protein [Bacteroidota bacterium]MBU1717944.1 nitroreductase family protein [Bacteroidota bacterium]